MWRKSMARKTGKIKQYEKRFGVIALEKGFITADDLIKALTIQANENIKKERHRLIGEILLGMELMSAKQIEEVVSTIIRERS
jgi:predicted N-acyltransferase